MPKITNPEYLRVVLTKEIELRGKDSLDEWIAKIPLTKKPRKATEAHCKVLLILLYYLGARPGEIIDLKPSDFEHVTLPQKGESPARNAYRITIKTLKKGKPLRTLHIPVNAYTSYCFNEVKKQHPAQRYFWAFVSRKGGCKNTVKWETHKKIYKATSDGLLTPEDLIEAHERLYFSCGNKINKYITALTGLPPYFFRHHRQTTMDEKGASLQEQADWKGGTIASANIYRASTGEKKKKQLNYF